MKYAIEIVRALVQPSCNVRAPLTAAAVRYRKIRMSNLLADKNVFRYPSPENKFRNRIITSIATVKEIPNVNPRIEKSGIDATSRINNRLSNLSLDFATLWFMHVPLYVWKGYRGRLAIRSNQARLNGVPECWRPGFLQRTIDSSWVSRRGRHHLLRATR